MHAFLARLLAAPPFVACLLAGVPPADRRPRGLRPEDRWRGKALAAAVEEEVAFQASALHQPPPLGEVDPRLLSRAEGLLLFRLAFPEPGDDPLHLHEVLRFLRRQTGEPALYDRAGRPRTRPWGPLLADLQAACGGEQGVAARRLLAALLAQARRAMEEEADERRRRAAALRAEAGPLRGRPARLARALRRWGLGARLAARRAGG